MRRLELRRDGTPCCRSAGVGHHATDRLSRRGKHYPDAVASRAHAPRDLVVRRGILRPSRRRCAGDGWVSWRGGYGGVGMIAPKNPDHRKSMRSPVATPQEVANEPTAFPATTVELPSES